MKKLWIKTLAMALAAVLCLAACPLTAAPATAEGEVHKLRLMGISPDNDYFKFDEREEFPAWKQWEDALKERGIELTYDLVARDQYSVMLQTMFATMNDMPDIVYLSGMDDASALSLANNGLIIDINAAISQYSDGTIEATIAEKAPFYGKAATAPDGKRYWLTNVQNLQYLPDVKNPDVKIDCPYVIGNAIRKDWLDKYNLEMPKTLDEYVNALKTFRDNDANGNGKNDEILMFDPYSYNFYSGIAQWFGLPPALLSVPIGIDMHNDTVVCAWDQPGCKAYFEFMRRLVDAGVFDTSMIGASDEQCNQAIAENRVSALRSYSTGLAWEQMINQDPNGTELYLIVPPIQTSEDIPAYSFYEPARMEWEKYAITSACKDVEGAIKLLDFCFSEEGNHVLTQGVEGIDYKEADDPTNPETNYYLCADGTFRHTSEKTAETPAMSNQEKYENRRGFGAAKWLGDVVLPRLQFGLTFFTSTDVRGAQKEAQQVELMQSEYYFPSNSTVYYAIATPEETEILEKYSAAYTTASEELAMQFILGQKSLDDWDKEMENLKAFGADEVLKVYQARHQRYLDSEN